MLVWFFRDACHGESSPVAYRVRAVKVRIERLVSALLMGHVHDDETSRWLGTFYAIIYEKLEAVGLVAKRQKQD